MAVMLAAVLAALTTSSATPSLDCLRVVDWACQQAAQAVIVEVELTDPKPVAHIQVSARTYCTETIGGGGHCLGGDARAVATFADGTSAMYRLYLEREKASAQVLEP
jgi:hypothetical protein